MAASSNNTSSQTTPLDSTASSAELTARAVNKRYESLVTVRTKAVKGKGAWYWACLDPVLVHNTDTGLPKAVKLRCSLCDNLFSASNPSRTASEHLKRGTCPNFNSLPRPISSLPPPSATAATPQHNHRKRSSGSSPEGASSLTSYQVTPLNIVDPSSRFNCQGSAHTMTAVNSPRKHLVLSGGKDDLGALAMLEDSVKMLKSPKTFPRPTLSKDQIDRALNCLADWVYESCGSVSLSSLEHPKFKAFLSQLGLPSISRREFAGARLDVKFQEARADSEARIRDALFFQISSDGWKCIGGNHGEDDHLVNLTVNLPNGSSLYRRAVFVSGSVPSSYAEEVLWETITDITESNFQRCVGIVSNKFKAKALRNLENQNHWMVNLSCQFQGFNSLLKDFCKDVPLFGTVIENCLKIASFVNNHAHVRKCFHKYQLQECGHYGLIRVPARIHDRSNFGPVLHMFEDIFNSLRALQLVFLDESFKAVSMGDAVASEVADMVQDTGFCNELEAAHSLIKLVKDMAREIESEKPLIGQCLPLWDELRLKIKDCCSKYQVPEAPLEKVVQRRFMKNYHPAWAAAFILNPLYMIRDTSGKYLPPFKCLTQEQEKDVDKLITRLVTREEAHIALMELMKWRTEGLDPVYARAVQMKERDSATGKMRLVNPQSSRLVWETYLTEFKSLGRVAVRLIFLHATSCGFKFNRSFLKWVSASARGSSRVGLDRAQKLVFLAAQAKLERRDFSSEDEQDAELFSRENGEDDVLVDASSS
ncbi:hypothetical protein SAY86_019478 [Trapa natans]|uniref:DUF7963 domain-containing protein n=1 Tax=Trapa natans TaxID=22666 RepID=A0AAN7LP12_TRANT|nr:hypothetical protein SAY86_019478 [Trapa natans]